MNCELICWLRWVFQQINCQVFINNEVFFMNEKSCDAPWEGSDFVRTELSESSRD